MTEDVLLFHVDARGVATATFNRPDVRNAYNAQMLEALMGALHRCASDDQVRVLVLRGNGPVFQAGADLHWMATLQGLSDDDSLEVSRQGGGVFRALTECPKPTVALVHGGCFGGGVGFVAGCDIAIASSETRFAITEARWGLLPSIILPQLNAAIGVRQVRRYALSCEQFSADTAKEIGLVHEICEPGAMDDAAAPILEGLLLSAPESLSQLKKLALEQAGLTMDDAYFERLVRVHADKRRSVEARDGVASFREKCPPPWFTPPSG